MILVSPDDFRFAGRLGLLCQAPSPADGSKSWLRSQQFAYDGRQCLTFRASDFHIGVVSRFRVGGEDHPWASRVARDSYRHFTLISDGGHFHVSAEPARCLQVGKDRREVGGNRTFSLRYPLLRVNSDTPFPGFSEPPPDARWETTQIRELWRTLTFLAPSGVDADPRSRMDSCTFLPDRKAVSWAGGVFRTTAAPNFGERIDLYRPHVVRFCRWVGLMMEKGHSEVRLAVAAPPQGQQSLLAATLDGDHFFQALRAPRPLPADAVDQFDVNGPLLEGLTPRKPLLEMAGMLRQSPGCKMIVTWHRDHACWTMNICTDDPAVPATGSLALANARLEFLDTIPNGFLVTAEHLRIALEAFASESLLVRFRPKTRTLILAAADQHGAHLLQRSDRAFIRIGCREADIA